MEAVAQIGRGPRVGLVALIAPIPLIALLAKALARRRSLPGQRQRNGLERRQRRPIDSRWIRLEHLRADHPADECGGGTADHVPDRLVAVVIVVAGVATFAWRGVAWREIGRALIQYLSVRAIANAGHSQHRRQQQADERAPDHTASSATRSGHMACQPCSAVCVVTTLCRPRQAVTKQGPIGAKPWPNCDCRGQQSTAPRYPRSGAARIRVQNTLYFELGA